MHIRHIFIISCLLMSFMGVARAQDPETLWNELQGMNEVNDESDSTMMLVKAIDTIPTPDKYVKIVLFDDHTWDYMELARPDIDTAGLFDGWDIESIHSFRELKVSDLPEEVELKLAGIGHPSAPPYVGKKSSSFKFRRGRPHNGIDIPLRVGDTIRSSFEGVVRYVGGGKATGGYGNLVVIRHPNGLETYYGHLSKRLVVENDVVEAGDPIGLGGNTGRSTGPHLHYETRYMGKPFDPERIIDFETGRLRDTMVVLKRHYFNVHSHYGMTDEESIKAAQAQYYKVRSGDTLSGIARKYGTTVNALCKLNGITSKKVLRIGQSIRVR